MIGNVSPSISGLLSSDIYNTTLPKTFKLSTRYVGIKLLAVKTTWVSYIAYVVGSCNGVIFDFTIGCIKNGSNLVVDVTARNFNTGSYRLYKDSDNVYLVCINSTTLNDAFIVYSSSVVERLTNINVTSMEEITIS